MNSDNPMLTNMNTSEIIRYKSPLRGESFVSYSVVVSVVTTVCTTLP